MKLNCIKEVIQEVDNKFTLGLDVGASQNLISKQLNSILRNVEKSATIKVGLDTSYVQQQLKALQQQLSNNSSGININLNGSTNAPSQALKGLQGQISATTQAQNNLNNSMLLMTKGKILSNQVISWYNDNQAAAKQYDSELKQIVYNTKNLSNAKQLSLLRAQFQNIKTEVTATDKVSKGFFGNLKSNLGQALQSMLKYQLAYKIINETVNSIKKMIQAVSDLDATLTSFNRLASLSKTELAEFTNQAYELADAIGRTGREVIQATTEFKRSGYTIDESLGLSKAAIILTNVSDGLDSTSEAASDLIAVLKGYNLNDSEVMSVVDKIDKVGNESAIGQADITEALKKVSGTLYQSGTTLDQTIGLVTGAFSQLRDIGKSANGLITISQRLRAIDEDGEAIDGLMPELQQAFGSIGVAIEDSNGELRSTYDIIKDYAAVFPTLTSEQRQYFGELAAGKRQVSVWNAMVQGINDVDKAVEQSTNSLGTAEAENEIYKNSIQGLKNEMQNAYDKLAIEVIDSDWIKDVIRALTSFLEVLTNIVKQDSLVSGAIGTMTSALKGLADILKAITDNKAVGTVIKTLLTLQTIKMGTGIFSFFSGKMQSQKAMQLFFQSALNGTLQLKDGFIQLGAAEQLLAKNSNVFGKRFFKQNSLIHFSSGVSFFKCFDFALDIKAA